MPNVFQVAFGAVILVDGGQTGIGRGARIHTAFAGRALGRRLQNYCVDWAVSKGISTQCFTEIHLGEIRRISDNYRMILVKVDFNTFTFIAIFQERWQY